VSINEALEIAGMVWLFSLLAYAVKRGVDAFWKKEK